MDFSKTLNLPQTDFPMKADLPTREPAMQAFWQEQNLYQKSLEKDAPRGTFILHDGPPYSNGNIHLGHALNKILKDLITRHRTMQGYRVPYVPGWDNHGLPIEVQVMKEFREKKQAWTPDTLRKRCRSFAAEWVAVQKTQFQRLGVRGDWEHPYLTMAPAFEAKIVEVFAELAKRGYVYRGLKPVLWDSANETALANTEAEYKDHVSPSIYVKFPLIEDAKGAFAGLDTSQLSAVIWTTTPWTIPANLALAFNADFDYTVARTETGELLLIAEDLRESVAKELETELVPVRTVRGADLEGSRFRHPLPEMNRDSQAVLGEGYITTETGTGIVHTAPGHGADDYNTGRKYGLPVLCVVDGRGRYTADAGPFVGWTVDEANEKIPERLREEGKLLAHKKYLHSYPHSPRAPYKPLLFRATVQWFISVDHEDLKTRALDEISKVRWFPAQSENRIRAAIAGRPDWTVSRQRYWGVGIPVFYANKEPVITEESLNAVVQLVRERGTDAWYEVAPEEILPPGFTYKGVPANEFVKETDVLDVWFDSGTTSMAVLTTGEWEHHRYPADVYLEGSDQHRGWFNSSLWLGTAVLGQAPYRQVVTNGFTVDERGYKMSKSKGNVVDPLGVIDTFGADVLRLWVASVEYQEDTKLGENLLKVTAESYRRLRNTFRFLLGNIYDFDPATDAVPVAEMDALDRWALSRLQKLVRTVSDAFEVYEFQQAMQAMERFCSSEMSAFYLDVLKDRLYTSLPEDPKRRSSQTALNEIASVLCRLLAPVLVHTCEEVWREVRTPIGAVQYLPPRESGGTQTIPSRQIPLEFAGDSPSDGRPTPVSVHLSEWPEVRTEWEDAELESAFALLFVVRDEFNRQLELARSAKILNKSVEAFAEVRAGSRIFVTLSAMPETVREALMVPVWQLTEDTTLPTEGCTVSVSPAPGAKCERCWFVREDVGHDPEFPTLSAQQAAIVRELVKRSPSLVAGTSYVTAKENL